MNTTVAKVFSLLQASRWRIARTGPRERIRKLLRLKAALVARRTRLAEAVRSDFGKHPFEFEVTEMRPVIDELNFAVRNLESWMRPVRVGTPLLLFRGSSEVRYQPKGVVLIMSPWNYPVNLALVPLISAVAAGNCVCIRPSSKVPLASRAVKDLVSRVFSPDEVAVVEGGHRVGDALLRLPFDHIFFTGSTGMGRKVMAAVARTLASVTLELGGKSPVVVDESADLGRAARRIAWAKFVNAGQTCVAPDYILVRREVEREFVAYLKKAVGEMYGTTERARKASPDFCRIISPDAVRRLKVACARTVAAGAKLEMGGRFEPGKRYAAPTILSGVPPKSAIMAGEIFGPVLPVLAFRRTAEAVRMIRSREAPLVIHVFAGRRRVVREVIAGTASGGVVVNGALVQLANPELPFGGTGASGQGRYHGYAGFQAFSNQRSVFRQGRPAFPDTVRPPYRGALKSGLGFFFGVRP